MENTNHRQKVSALAVFFICQILLSSCAHKIRVRENWKASQKAPINYQDAAATWNRLKRGSSVGESELERYNKTVRETVSQLAYNWSNNRSALAEISTERGKVKIDIDASEIDNAHLIDHLVPADFVKIRNGLHSRTIVKGVGAPMVARREWSENDPLVPKTGLWFPLTAYLNFDSPNHPVLSLKDPTRQSDLVLSGRKIPFAANYSAFVARDFKDRQKLILDVPAMFRFEWFESRMGISRISEFDPNKMPCVLIHGINSSPLTWNNTVNEMLANKEVREKYEFWTFGYPSGAPIPYLAMKLREAVDEMHSFREKNGAVSPKLTIIAHSMGGLLAKTLTQNSGDKNWNRVFNVPPEDLKVTAQNRELLRKMMYFESHDHIEKMIFISTPHRGSEVARSAPAHIVANLIQAPKRLLSLSREILTLNPSALTPFGREFAIENPTSLEQMRSNSKMIDLLTSMPLNPEVRYFSIIGNNSKTGVPLEETSDNVVPYLSAHLIEAESEKVIRSPHAVHKCPEGVAEIVRILNLK